MPILLKNLLIFASTLMKQEDQLKRDIA